ncbi:ribonuclease H-like domain-containing protein [Stachybotrys elegans]|uniref:Ribonuclease H-like domain-containing protein n=1 Tax=Stachybotrys elegans TaxID=80388 RepID=A0A8K0SJ03_9HYPO|nr:ribonuclease H-like domain-containing protein [Stachybotrys elegans]
MASSTQSATSPTLVSSLPDLQAFLSSITSSSILYLDLEGKKLSRNGTLTLMAVHIQPAQATSLIDVQTLGKAAFITSSADNKTLKSILEDPSTPKLLWDVRNDADALWAHYGVGLEGVTDVQLLENAYRSGDKTYVRGLKACVQADLKLKAMEINRWTQTKKEVQDLMARDIFSCRPLDPKVMQYCVNDVVYLPALHDIYTRHLDRQSLEQVKYESARRVALARDPAYNPESEMKKLGPWGSGSGKIICSIHDLFERLEDERMDEEQKEWLEPNAYEYDDMDDYPDNSKDAAWDDTFDSCWEK